MLVKACRGIRIQFALLCLVLRVRVQDYSMRISVRVVRVSTWARCKVGVKVKVRVGDTMANMVNRSRWRKTSRIGTRFVRHLRSLA